MLESDLGFEHTELPPERPLTEATSLLFVIQRDIIIKAAAEIYDATEAGPPSPATSAALAAKLSRAVDAIPEWLRYKPIETLLTENPVTVMNRMFLDILIHKATYLLHRRSFVKNKSGGEGAESRELCIKASLAILEHQRLISEEIQPGGLMSGIGWKVTPAMAHEFLQATMMLCFALSKFNEDPGAVTSYAFQRREDILQTLTHTKFLWERNSNQCIAAWRAAKAVSTVLQQDVDESSQTTPAAAAAASDGELLPWGACLSLLPCFVC